MFSLASTNVWKMQFKKGIDQKLQNRNIFFQMQELTKFLKLVRYYSSKSYHSATLSELGKLLSKSNFRCFVPLNGSK
jgi:hypothetical protein